MATLHETLLGALAASRALEAPLAAACDDAPPPAPDAWTARDHLAHLAHYRDRVAGALAAVRDGRPAFPEDEAGDDERNREMLAESRARGAAAVRAWADDSHERLAEAVRRCSAEELLRPWSAASGDPTWWLACCWRHAGHHLVQVHVERGERAAAEAVARRVYEIDLTGFGDRRYEAVAAYDAGCSYANIGRHDEALALVRQALAADPGLRDWARDDPDLAPIRGSLDDR